MADMPQNPYQSPQEQQAPPAKKRSGTGSITAGVICVVLACGGLNKTIQHRSWLDHDLPFIAGELFVPFAFLIVGAFLVWSGYKTRRAGP
jgi:surface polysaccharide O-acyltransferase-like enzyme